MTDAQKALDWFNKSLESEYPPEPNAEEYANCVRCVRFALQKLIEAERVKPKCRNCGGTGKDEGMPCMECR